MKFTKEQLQGLVRHVLTFVGGFLLTKGIIDDSILVELIGGAVTLTGAIWSVVAKQKNA
jgi:hypothetical protein